MGTGGVRGRFQILTTNRKFQKLPRRGRILHKQAAVRLAPSVGVDSSPRGARGARGFGRRGKALWSQKCVSRQAAIQTRGCGGREGPRGKPEGGGTSQGRAEPRRTVTWSGRKGGPRASSEWPSGRLGAGREGSVPGRLPASPRPVPKRGLQNRIQGVCELDGRKPHLHFPCRYLNITPLNCETSRRSWGRAPRLLPSCHPRGHRTCPRRD